MSILAARVKLKDETAQQQRIVLSRNIPPIINPTNVKVMAGMYHTDEWIAIDIEW